jgi:hypothetical protein
MAVAGASMSTRWLLVTLLVLLGLIVVGILAGHAGAQTPGLCSETWHRAPGQPDLREGDLITAQIRVGSYTPVVDGISKLYHAYAGTNLAVPYPEVAELVVTLDLCPPAEPCPTPSSTRHTLTWTAHATGDHIWAWVEWNGGQVISINNGIACDLSWSTVASVCQCSTAPPCLGQYLGGPAAGSQCYLMPPGNTGMTAEQKQFMQNYASVLGVISAGLQYCKHPTCGIGQQILGVSTVLLDLMVRVDPPDPNYLETAVIVPTAYTPLVPTCKGKKCSVTLAEAEAANALFDTLAVSNGIEDAILTTTNRLSTAIADDRFDGISLQINYLSVLKAEWAVRLLDTGPQRQALAAVLNQRQAGLGDVWIPLDATPAEVALAQAVTP